MPAPLAYLNGQYLPFGEAALPLNDAGFVSGATVVDNARTFQRKLFRWPDHLARFRRDCQTCAIPLSLSDEQLTVTAEQLVSHNAQLLVPDGELQLVTFATPGPLGFYLGESTPNGPATLGMVTYPLPVARYRHFFTEGVTLEVVGTQHSDDSDLLPPRVKHRSRMFWHIAGHRLQTPGAVPVVLNQNGVGDTAIGAILAVAGETVIHPIPGTVQASISAQVVRELCEQLGLRSVEARLDLREMSVRGQQGASVRAGSEVTELLLAGTGFCVAGVRRLITGTATWDYPWPGKILRQLTTTWSARVGVELPISRADDEPTTVYIVLPACEGCAFGLPGVVDCRNRLVYPYHSRGRTRPTQIH